VNGESPDERKWYYYLDQAQGPYCWGEIQALIGAGDLTPDVLVARAGDTEWRPAYEVAHEMERTAETLSPLRGGEVPTAPPQAAEWAYPSIEPKPEAEPKDAAHGGAMQPEFGIGRWISQGWEIVIGDPWPFVGATLLWVLISQLSLGICGPPMQVGLFMMCLRRYEGERVGAAQVFDGFRYFWSSWGLSLLMGMIMLTAALPAAIAFIIAELANHADRELVILLGTVVSVPVLVVVWVVIAVATFFSWALIADGRAGAMNALEMSWAKVRRNSWSFLGMILVFGMLANLGSSVLYVGWLISYPLWPACTVAVYRYYFPSQSSVRASGNAASN